MINDETITTAGEGPETPAQLEARKKRAQDLEAIATAEQKAAEARKATAVADAGGAHAAEDQRRASEKADVEHKQALADAAKATAEAVQAEEASKREAAGADAKAKLEQAKAEAETRKAVADAEVGTIKAFLPGDPTLKPLEGTVEADATSGVLAEALANVLLTNAVSELIKTVKPKVDGKRILVLSGAELAQSDWPYHAVTTRITQLGRALELATGRLTATAPPPEPPDPPPAGQEEVAGIGPIGTVAAIASALPNIVGAAADVAGYFQSNYKVTGRQMAAKDEPLVAALSAGLLGLGANVVVDSFRTLPEGSVFLRYTNLLERGWVVAAAQIEAEARVPATTAERDDARIALEAAQKAHKAGTDATLQELATDLAKAERDMARADAKLTALQAANDAAKGVVAAVDDFAAKVTTVPSDGGLPPLGLAALREALHGSTLGSDDAQDEGNEKGNEQGKDGQALENMFRPDLVAYVSVSHFAGETQMRQRRFFAPTVRYLGTCTFSVLMASPAGDLKFSSTKTVAAEISQKLSKGGVSKLQAVKIDATP